MFSLALAVLSLGADPAPGEEKLLAKGDGYFVHAVRSGPLSLGEFGATSFGRDVFERPGKYILTHLNTTTGKLSRLHSGGQWGKPLVQGGIDRSHVYRQYIWGVTADECNLYVLLGRTHEVTEYFEKGGLVRKLPSTVIQVFRLKDAELVQNVELPKALHTEVEILTYDKLDRTPLTVTKTGLVVGEEKQPHARLRFTDQHKLEPATDRK